MRNHNGEPGANQAVLCGQYRYYAIITSKYGKTLVFHNRTSALCHLMLYRISLSFVGCAPTFVTEWQVVIGRVFLFYFYTVAPKPDPGNRKNRANVNAIMRLVRTLQTRQNSKGFGRLRASNAPSTWMREADKSRMRFARTKKQSRNHYHSGCRRSAAKSRFRWTPCCR